MKVRDFISLAAWSEPARKTCKKVQKLYKIKP
jgi:hypothetical protein